MTKQAELAIARRSMLGPHADRDGRRKTITVYAAPAPFSDNVRGGISCDGWHWERHLSGFRRDSCQDYATALRQRTRRR